MKNDNEKVKINLRLGKNMINPNIFRPYDIRGKYPDEINEDAVEKITKAFLCLYPKIQKIALARDSRLSSPSLSKKIKQVLILAGKEVYDLGIAPDGVYFFSILNYKFDAGIMVTASHNPKEFNGMSFYLFNGHLSDINVRLNAVGRDIIGQDLQEVGKMAQNKDIDKIFNKHLSDINRHLTDINKHFAGTIIDIGGTFNPFGDYLNVVLSKIKPKKKLKIIIDSGNGACGFLPEKIFKKFDFHTETLNGEFDGNFPAHLPDPYLEKNLEQIKKAVIEKEADLGFAFDTDGDRVAVIDNRGRVVSGDDFLYFLALDAIQRKKGPIVHDVRVSKAFLDELEKQGVESHFSISHHSAIIRKIIETKAVFGGEITLHFLFPLDYYLCDDAIFSALKIAEIASKYDDFAEFIDSIPHYPTSPEIFIPVLDEEKYGKIEKLKSFLHENKYNFIDIDGARINFENGWALARASNTEPLIKVRFEGKTKEDLNEIIEKSKKIFEKAGIPTENIKSGKK